MNDVLLECNKSLNYICSCMYVSNINKDEEKRDFFAKYLLDNDISKDTIKNVIMGVDMNNLPHEEEVVSFYNDLNELENKKYDYIKQGDCLKLLKELKDNTVDVSFTSPPYNDTGTKNEDVGNLKSHNTHKKYLHVENRKDWFEWQCEVIDEMLRVSKKYVLYNVQGLKSNRHNVYKLIGHYADRIHDIVIWYKPNGAPTSTPHKLSNKYEFLLILKCDGVKGVDVSSRFYTNVIVQNINPNKEFAKIHRAVMNKAFCDEVIKEFTFEGDVVLDPFFGMGTTGVSCVEQNRHYIGFEMCEEYCNAARERIKNVINNN